MTLAAEKVQIAAGDTGAARDGELSSLLQAHLNSTRGGDLWGFHQLFQQSIGANQRRRRGVYCTPLPVASYIVRSVDYLLRERLALTGGIAGDARPGARRLRIIDPACGSGVFLSEVVRLARGRFQELHDAAGWRRFAQSLSRSAAGFDVLPEAIAAAGLLLEHQLTGRDLPLPQREAWACGAARAPAALHLANPLAGGAAIERIVLGDADRPVLVVVGNPPYGNFGRNNRAPWILQQLQEYKRGLGEKKLNLNDDFIKFFRWGQHWIDRAGSGVLALVTSSTYLAGLTHRRMRKSLMQSFDEIHILDLHGDGARRKCTSDDQNVFDIRQGVAIGLFVKSARSEDGRSSPSRVFHAELCGSREAKFDVLAKSHVGSTARRRLSPLAAHFFFSPHAPPANEYARYPRLDEMFCHSISGVQTKNDALFVGFSPDEVAGRVRAELAERNARGECNIRFDEACLQPYVVAPFDRRWIYYDPRLLGRARFSVMRHMLKPNAALVFMRQSATAGEYDHFLVVDSLASDRCFYSPHGAPYLAPLFLHDEQGGRRPNFEPEFLREFAARLKMRKTPRAEDAFHYLYALFHSPTYRTRYAEELRIDFPRLPLTCDRELFNRLRRIGKSLAALHLAAGNNDQDVLARFPICGDNLLARGYPKFQAPADGGRRRAGRVLINRRQAIDGIDQATWETRVGGYAVLKRWLAGRRHRPLAEEDIHSVLHIARVVRRTRRLMAKVDLAIGEWPIR